MDYVNPSELIAEALRAARRKADLSISDMLLRGALAGEFLGFATSLVFVVKTQGVPPIVGAFPAQTNTQGTLFFYLLPFLEQDNLYRQAEGSVWKKGTLGTPLPIFLAFFSGAVSLLRLGSSWIKSWRPASVERAGIFCYRSWKRGLSQAA